MMDVPILNMSREWSCPNCDVVDVTRMAEVHTRMHSCAGAGGLTLPLVDQARARERGRGRHRVRPLVREDYVGTERGLVYDAEGCPIMAAVTEYDDGSNDVAVFAPVAQARMGEVA